MILIQKYKQFYMNQVHFERIAALENKIKEIQKQASQIPGESQAQEILMTMEQLRQLEPLTEVIDSGYLDIIQDYESQIVKLKKDNKLLLDKNFQLERQNKGLKKKLQNESNQHQQQLNRISKERQQDLITLAQFKKRITQKQQQIKQKSDNIKKIEKEKQQLKAEKQNEISKIMQKEKQKAYQMTLKNNQTIQKLELSEKKYQQVKDMLERELGEKINVAEKKIKLIKQQNQKNKQFIDRIAGKIKDSFLEQGKQKKNLINNKLLNYKQAKSQIKTNLSEQDIEKIIEIGLLCLNITQYLVAFKKNLFTGSFQNYNSSREWKEICKFQDSTPLVSAIRQLVQFYQNRNADLRNKNNSIMLFIDNLNEGIKTKSVKKQKCELELDVDDKKLIKDLIKQIDQLVIKEVTLQKEVDCLNKKNKQLQQEITKNLAVSIIQEKNQQQLKLQLLKKQQQLKKSEARSRNLQEKVINMEGSLQQKQNENKSIDYALRQCKKEFLLQKQTRKQFEKSVKKFERSLSEHLSAPFKKKIDLHHYGQYEECLGNIQIQIHKLKMQRPVLAESEFFRNLDDSKKLFLTDLINEAIPGRSPLRSKTVIQVVKSIENLSEVFRRLNGKPNILVLIQLENDYKIGGFTQEPFNQTTRRQGLGFIFSVTKQKKYKLRPRSEVSVIKPDHYYIIFGNSQIVIKPKGIITSLIGTANNYFDMGNGGTNQFFGFTTKQIGYESIEFHQIMYD